MENLSDNIIACVAGLSGRLGPLSTLVSAVAERIAPTVVAAASSCPPSGKYVCSEYCEDPDRFCFYEFQQVRVHYTFGDTLTQCQYAPWGCSVCAPYCY